jgi:hypothetical protein
MDHVAIARFGSESRRETTVRGIRTLWSFIIFIVILLGEWACGETAAKPLKVKREGDKKVAVSPLTFYDLFSVAFAGMIYFLI